MKLFECFILLLGTSIIYCVSAQEETSNSSVPLAEHTTSMPVTELNSSSPVETSSISSVSSKTEPPAANKSVPEVTTKVPVEKSDETVYTMEVPEPSELMLVLNNSGKACILLKMEVTLTLEYKNSSDSTVSGVFPLTDAVVDQNRSSNCESSTTDQTEYLYANFNMSNSLYFFFNHTSKDKFAISQLRLNSTNLNSLFPDAMDNQTLTLQSDQSIFETSSNMSFKCDSETKVNLVDLVGNATNSYITFKMVQVEAFRATDDANFANAMDCAADEEISNIVPIAVGCALAGLVCIVLIAYLIGRRQKRQRGYESV